MAPKPEAEIARSHLEKARVEANQKDLARLLNEERKAVFYEGEDPDLGDLSIDEVLEDLLTMVEIAERDAG
jgi:hypothetical protein